MAPRQRRRRGRERRSPAPPEPLSGVGTSSFTRRGSGEASSRPGIRRARFASRNVPIWDDGRWPVCRRWRDVHTIPAWWAGRVGPHAIESCSDAGWRCGVDAATRRRCAGRNGGFLSRAPTTLPYAVRLHGARPRPGDHRRRWGDPSHRGRRPGRVRFTGSRRLAAATGRSDAARNGAMREDGLACEWYEGRTASASPSVDARSTRSHAVRAGAAREELGAALYARPRCATRDLAVTTDTGTIPCDA